MCVFLSQSQSPIYTHNMTTIRRIPFAVPSLVVIDFDLTLIHTVHRSEMKHVAFHKGFNKFYVASMDSFVFIRPHSIQFLRFLFNNPNRFKVVFWTAGTKEYAEDIFCGIMEFVNMPYNVVLNLWNRNQTIVTPVGLVKDLNDVCYAHSMHMQSCILIDDDLRHSQYPPNVLARRLKVSKFSVFESKATYDYLFHNLLREFQVDQNKRPPILQIRHDESRRLSMTTPNLAKVMRSRCAPKKASSRSTVKDIAFA